MKVLGVMLADAAKVTATGGLDVRNGGGIFVSPPHLPESYTATIAGYALQEEGDQDVEELVIHLQQPDRMSSNPLVMLRMQFVHASDPWPDEPVTTAFVAPISMDLFNEGVHRLVLVQRGYVKAEVPFLARIIPT